MSANCKIFSLCVIAFCERKNSHKAWEIGVGLEDRWLKLPLELIEEEELSGGFHDGDDKEEWSEQEQNEDLHHWHDEDHKDELSLLRRPELITPEDMPSFTEQHKRMKRRRDLGSVQEGDFEMENDEDV